MPFYQDLKHRPEAYGDEDPKYIAARLLDLRQQLGAIPERELRRSLILGTWNIRDFDSNKFRQGPRRREALHYLAEVLARFDICAVQEINDDIRPLERVVELMGPTYQYMATDVTLGASGNGERLAFVYDSRKVRFRNIVGELVLPPAKTGPTRQIARTPFIAAFQAGWFKFVICTAHIYYGEDSPTSEGYKRRVEEIATIAKILATRSTEESQNYIFLGDFNVVSRTDATFLALKDAGFVVPDEIHGSNMGGDRDYDQIAYLAQPGRLRKEKAGVFDWRGAVFRDADFDRYRPVMAAHDENGKPVPEAKLRAQYEKWRTWQMSDHLPLWVQFEVDFSDAYLESIANPQP